MHAAGRDDEAVEHAAAAAFAAGQALAFDHAAELYRFALTCKPAQWSLQKNCAEALVQAGRGAEAAPLFLAAAEAAPEGRRHAPAPRGRGAVPEPRLPRSRHRDPRPAAARGRSIEVPTSARELNAQLVAHTDRVVQRGLEFSERSEFEIGRRDLDRIDLCWAAGKGLLLNDPIRSGYFLAQCTHLALEAGEPRRVARSLALFGLAHTSRSHDGGVAMLAASERIGQRIHDPYAIGLGTLCRGILTRTDGHWLMALADLDFGVQYLREHCPGSAWECSLGQGSIMAALEALGELRSMSERSEQMLRRAQEIGDMHTSLIAAMYSALTLLASGAPAQARARVRGALAHWPRHGFHVQHLHALKLEVYCDLYEGRAADAWQRIVTAWSDLEESSFLRLSARRAEALTLRAKASLAVLRAAPAEHEHLLDIVAQDIQQLEREGRGHLQAEAALLRAGLATCLGDTPAAGRHLDAAVSGFEAAGMSLSAVVVRRLRARGRDGVARAEALMRMQDIADPAAWSRVVAPGLAR
jgi:tetratricopeptide (TPR) repeat protein